MRTLTSTGLAIAVVLLAGSVDTGGAAPPDSGVVPRVGGTSFDGDAPSLTAAELAVRSPVVSFRVPSSLAMASTSEPEWIARMADGAPSIGEGGTRVPLRSAAVEDVADARVARFSQEGALTPYEFYFTRAAYSGSRGGWGRGGGRGQAWATDFPKADQQFMVVLRRLTSLDAYPDENAVLLNDPAIRRFPFLYALEVGYMNLRPEEISGLRDYLDAGGFLMVDDFWGVAEWRNFEAHMAVVFPGRPIQDIPLDHPLFDMVYDIDEVLQVPARGRGIYGIPTWERPDATVPTVSGIFDDRGRLMVVVNWNTDLGDAWEWAEAPDYPVEYSTYAFQVGVNTIVYGMSH